MNRICLIAMKATLDRMDALLDKDPHAKRGPHFRDPLRVSLSEGQCAVNSKDDKLMIDHADLKAIRDDLWAAWFELKDQVK